MKLKVMTLGREKINRKVTSSLARCDIEIVCQSKVSEALKLLKQEKFDLALVDGYMDNLETTCFHINRFCLTPIVLVINGDHSDWAKLRSMDVDGFIPEEVSNMELMAYFQAIVRRFHSKFNLN